MAADDVAVSVARTAVGKPVNGIVEVAGPEPFRLTEFIQQGSMRRTIREKSSRIRMRATSERC
jgi:hypothetical protein